MGVFNLCTSQRKPFSLRLACCSKGFISPCGMLPNRLQNSILKGESMRILIISILALTGLRSIAPAAEHVVASDADFIAVQEQVQPGDIVRIQPGDYGELSWTASGAPGNPIRVLGI